MGKQALTIAFVAVLLGVFLIAGAGWTQSSAGRATATADAAAPVMLADGTVPTVGGPVGPIGPGGRPRVRPGGGPGARPGRRPGVSPGQAGRQPRDLPGATGAGRGPRVDVQLPNGQTLRTLGQQFPKTLPYYPCSADTATAQRVAAALAKYFGLRGSLARTNDSTMKLKQSGRVVEILPESASVFAADLNRLWARLPEQGRQAPLTTDSATQGAVSFLQQIAAPLGDDYVAQARQDTIVLTTAGAGGAGQTTKLAGPMQVSVRPKVNGLPTVGGGEKLKVFYDNDGKIAGCLIVKRKLGAAAGQSPLIPLPQAVRKLAQDAATSGLTLYAPRRIVITSITLAYYGECASEEQRYLQPVYVFRGTVSGTAEKGEWQLPYEQYVEALPNPPEAIWATDTGADSTSKQGTAGAEGPEDGQ